MGRRASSNNPKGFLSFHDVSNAKSIVHQAMLVEHELFLPRMTASEAVELMFSEEDRNVARAAKGVVSEPYSLVQYNLQPLGSANLQISYADLPLLPIATYKFEPNLQTHRALVLLAAEARAIAHKYYTVIGLIDWFNLNATAGATRALWPSMMKLLPQANCFRDMMDAPPSRFNEPPRWASLLGAIRDSSATVAAMSLQPDSVKARVYNGLALTLTGGMTTVHQDLPPIELAATRIHL